MDELYDSRWQELWSDVCDAFESEAGNAPPQKLEPWEACLLQRLVFNSLTKPLAKRLKRQESHQSLSTNQTLVDMQKRLQQMVIVCWQQADAEMALKRAHEHECCGEWEQAREAYSEALCLGPSGPSAILSPSGPSDSWVLRFAQLLHVMAACGSGDEGACEQVLRHAISTGGKAKRALLQRLILLLLQQGRHEEARPLLTEGGWKYCLAPWILCPDGLEQPGSDDGFPGCVLDNAIPEAFLNHLQTLLCPASNFWTEHVYNEILGSSEVGYFSYVQDLGGETQNTLDLVIAHVWELLKKTNHFPGLGEAKVAEWWAHKRPHGCGHQMHYDSDNEGIGGVRNPICSCIIYVNAPLGGGPTLVTDQKLAEKQLGSKGWLVTPRVGRLAAYDGTYFHGVVPGCGKAPSGEPSLERRITFMIAFWKDGFLKRPFKRDGLPGSSRPVPNPAQILEIGSRRYTWHRELALPLDGADTGVSPIQVFPPCRKPIWTEAHGGHVGEGVPLPDIQECFQF
eukprot:Skav231017  [mRNA]  locus=scaffold1869:28029:29561:+ [translate_table: standard]